MVRLFQTNENARPEAKIFEQKCKTILNAFESENVPGNGFCLVSSVESITGIPLRHRLPAFAAKYQSELEGLIDLTNELDNPNNLSETWVSFLADELCCRFVIFTYQQEKRASRTKDSYGTMEICGFHNKAFDETHYLLLKCGHYYPLFPQNEFDLDDLKTGWCLSL